MVMAEEYLKLRKSKPVLVAAGIIWIVIGLVYAGQGLSPPWRRRAFGERCWVCRADALLLVAMTYVNAMEDRLLFAVLRVRLVQAGFSLRTLFWLTGFLAFSSPRGGQPHHGAADVLRGAQRGQRGAPLHQPGLHQHSGGGQCGRRLQPGDITTLMVWQAGRSPSRSFCCSSSPALLNFLVPASQMSLMVPRLVPAMSGEALVLRRGAFTIVLLFVLTIMTAVACHHFLALPPVLGMMMGLGYLQFFGFYLRKTQPVTLARERALYARTGDEARLLRLGSMVPFDVFNKIAKAEWDTLLFFYGVVMCVGGLGFMGYLALASQLLYQGIRPWRTSPSACSPPSSTTFR